MRFLFLLLTLLFVPGIAFGQLTAVQKQGLPVINQAFNPGFENGKSGWTASGGTFSVATSAGNTIATWDASSDTQTLSGKSVAVDERLKGRTCSAEMLYKGGDANLKFQVYDGSSVIAEQTLTATTIFTAVRLFFTCPSSGSFLPRLIASADAATVDLDDAHIGNKNILNVSQAEFVGSISGNEASCQWAYDGSAVADAAADSDCWGGQTTTIGKGQIPSVKVPGIKIDDAPKGLLLVKFSGGFFTRSSSDSASYGCRIEEVTAGLAPGAGWVQHGGTAQSNIPLGRDLSSVFENTSTQDLEFRLRCFETDSAGSGLQLDASVSSRRVEFSVVKYPTDSSEAVTLETSGGYIKANHDSDCLFQRTSTGIGAFAADSTCTFNEISSIGALSVSELLSSGDDLAGITVNSKVAGRAWICASFAGALSSGNASEYAYFSLRGTPNGGSEKVLDENEHRIDSGTGGGNETRPYKLCGALDLTVGDNTFYLYGRKTSGTGTIEIFRTLKPFMIMWEGFLIENEIPTPVFTDLTTSLNSKLKSDQNGMKVCAYTSSDTSGTSVSDITNCISSVSALGSGTQRVSWESNTWASGDYSCTCTVFSGAAADAICEVAASPSTAQLDIRTIDSGSAGNEAINVVCVGPSGN